MAHEVCRIQGFLSAEAAVEGDKNVSNGPCVSNQEYNKTCEVLQREMQSSCYNMNEAVAVCKGKKEYIANLIMLLENLI